MRNSSLTENCKNKLVKLNHFMSKTMIDTSNNREIRAEQPIYLNLCPLKPVVFRIKRKRKY